MTQRSVAGKRISRILVLGSIGACLAGGASISAHAPSSDPFKGLSLASALTRLQQNGLRLVYSTDLVRPEMIVVEEPRGRWPQEILDELLAPHGLRSKRGPAGALLIVKAPPAVKAPSHGSIQGTVRFTSSRQTVPGVHVVVVGAGVEAHSDNEGRFTVGPLPEGRYVIEVRPAGYQPQRVEHVPVTAGTVTRIRLEISPPHVYVEKIVVTGRDQSSQRGQPDVRERLGRNEIQASPEFGSDPMLAVARLSGIAASDGSGGLNVRGGSSREAKIILDGLELSEPYHLKDRGGPISIINSDAIGGIGLLTGAFPAEYGGHMSAVVEMDTIVPSGELDAEVAVNVDDARFANQGVVNDRLRWIVSGRRGDSSRLLNALGADPSYHPTYWDVLGKADYRLDERTTLSFHLLAGDDEVEGGDSDEVINTVHERGTFRSRHTNGYGWITLKRAFTSGLFSQTVVSNAHVTNDRFGSSPRVAVVRDSRSVGTLGLKQDWLRQSPRHLVKWGLDIKHVRADYAYTSNRVVEGVRSKGFGFAGPPGSVAISRSPRGNDVGVYVADRFRVSPQLNVELGLRWDAQTYSRDRSGSLGPRINAVYAIGPRTALRLGWGYFYQPQKIHELQVEDGVEEFLPAERAEHRLISFAHEFQSGFRAQLNAYQNLVRDVNPRFENLFDSLGFFPEADGDRVRVAPEAARAEGVELVVRRARRTTGWWAAYTLARAEDEIGGRWVPRSWDQRHALNIGVDWKPNTKWALALAGSFHSGRPTTPLTAEASPLGDGSLAIVPVFGARNSERLPAYSRIDMRVSRSLRIWGSDVRGTLTVTDAFNRANTCGVADFSYTARPDGTVAVERHLRHGLPRLVTLGLSWKF